MRGFRPTPWIHHSLQMTVIHQSCTELCQRHPLRLLKSQSLSPISVLFRTALTESSTESDLIFIKYISFRKEKNKKQPKQKQLKKNYSQAMKIKMNVSGEALDEGVHVDFQLPSFSFE